MATHSSILAWRIPWTEETGRLQSMGLQRVGSNLATKQQQSLCCLMDYSGFLLFCDPHNQLLVLTPLCLKYLERFLALQGKTFHLL